MWPGAERVMRAAQLRKTVQNGEKFRNLVTGEEKLLQEIHQKRNRNDRLHKENEVKNEKAVRTFFFFTLLFFITIKQILPRILITLINTFIFNK